MGRFVTHELTLSTGTTTLHNNRLLCTRARIARTHLPFRSICCKPPGTWHSLNACLSHHLSEMESRKWWLLERAQMAWPHLTSGAWLRGGVFGVWRCPWGSSTRGGRTRTPPIFPPASLRVSSRGGSSPLETRGRNSPVGLLKLNQSKPVSVNRQLVEGQLRTRG